MSRETIRLPHGAVVVADYDGARRDANATVGLNDGSQESIAVRGRRIQFSYEGSTYEGEIEDSGKVRVKVKIDPDGTRHDCEFEI